MGRSKRINRYRLLSCSLLTCWAPQLALADQGNQAGTDASISSEDIIVTARRREERLLDVPVAVSALSGQALTERGITTLDAVARAIPGFQMQAQSNQKNNVAYTIRAQRQSESVLTQDLSVSVYFADVTIARSALANGGLYDLASVQVLKGPQGTLFGRNSTGGAVVITPQAPTMDFGGYVIGRIGNLDARYLEGALNLPISDDLQIRVSGQLARRDGYIKNLFDGRMLGDDHTNSARLSVRFTPTSNLKNDFVLNYYEIDEAGTTGTLFYIGAPATTRNPGLADALARIQAAGKAVDSNAALADFGHTLHLSNITTLDLDWLTIKNIAGYRRVKAQNDYDHDATQFTIFPGYRRQIINQYSDELQFIGKALDNRLDYIVGLYYFLEKGFEINGNAPLGAQRTSTGDVRNESYSAFAQVSYKILDAVSLTGGLRQTKDKRQILNRNFAGAYNPALGNFNNTLPCALTTNAGVALNPCERLSKKDFEKLTYNFSVDWHITPDILLYATHRLGYRAGGFNFRSNTPSQAQPFRPEVVKDYEVGLKSDWRLGGDARARLNVAAYFQDYKDIQRQASLFIGGVFAGSIIGNAAKARINGLEVEAMVQPVRWIELNGFYARAKPKYKSYTAPQATGPDLDLTGTPFAGAPTNSGGGSIRFTLPVDEAIGDISLSGDVYAQSGTYVQDGGFNAVTQQRYAQARIPGYHVFNARAQWANVAASGLDVSFFVNNLTDKSYLISGLDLVDAGVGVTTYTYAPPRTYGLELKYSF